MVEISTFCGNNNINNNNNNIMGILIITIKFSVGIPNNKNVPINAYESHHCINLQREGNPLYYNVLPYIKI